MSKIDIDLTEEMWVYLIKKYNSKLKYDANALTDGMINEIYNQASQERTAIQLVTENELIKNACFSQSEDVGGNACQIIMDLVLDNRLEKVNELLTLVYHNKNRKQNFYIIMDNVIPREFDLNGASITEEAFNLISIWNEKITDKKQRAKINVKMLDLMDEE